MSRRLFTWLAGVGLGGLLAAAGQSIGRASMARAAEKGRIGMPGRKVEFFVGGKFIRAYDRDDVNRLAVRVSAQEVIAAWRASGTQIPVQFAAAMAEREAGYAVNEVDTEPSGFVSKGIFQISDEEAASVGLPHEDLLTLAGSVRVFAPLMERHLTKILGAANLEAPTRDTWAYLGMAHNMGIGEALKSIRKYGLDWQAYKARNPGLPIVAKGYGDTMISGGKAFAGAGAGGGASGGGAA